MSEKQHWLNFNDNIYVLAFIDLTVGSFLDRCGIFLQMCEIFGFLRIFRFFSEKVCKSLFHRGASISTLALLAHFLTFGMFSYKEIESMAS